jgi:hypothetical protein
MNKLLQYLISETNVEGRVLPGLQKMQKGGTGKVLPKQSVDPRVFPKETLENRQKVYRTVRPTDYTDIKNYARYFFNNDRDEWDDERSEEAFKIYLGLQPKPEYFRPSKYKPTINADPNGYYYSADEQLEQDIFNSFKDKVKPGQILPTDEYYVDSKFPGNPNAFWENGKQMVKLDPNDEDLIMGRPMASRARALGQFVVSRGSDKEGDYLSYADQYDFPEKLQNKMQGKPYKIYGRVYYPKDKPKKVYGGENPFLDMLKQKYGGQPCYQCGGMYDQGGPILDPRGQWAHPGKVTRIPSDNITMQGVNYPVLGVGSNGQQQMMYPEQEYDFGGASYVDEYPMMQNGGGLLSKSVSCSNCGHSWKSVEGGIDPLNCHKCGGVVKMQRGGYLLTAQDGRTIRAANGEFSCAANPRSDLRASAASVSGGSSDPLQDAKNNYWSRIKEDWQAQGVNKESFNNMYEDSLRAGPAFENPLSSQYFDPSTGKARPGTPGRLRYYKEAGYPLGVRPTLEQIKNTALEQPKGVKGYNKLVKEDYPWGVSPYIPTKKSGGQHGGLDRWFAEKWVDVKTGKDCGRQEGESRAGYPACRPSKRVNSQTPKTFSEMSSAEKAKFKSSKTSSQRIDYNHKRNK